MQGKRFEIDFTGAGNLRHARAEAPYVIISKEIANQINPNGKQGKDFTVLTLGVYTKIRTLPPNWEFKKANFAKILNIGRDTLNKEIRILEEYGYLICAQRKGAGGKFEDDFTWVTLDDNADYPFLVQELRERGFVVKEKMNVENSITKHQVKTDILKSSTTVLNRENAETPGQSTVENSIAKPQVKTDILKSSTTVLTRENIEKPQVNTELLKYRSSDFRSQSNNIYLSNTIDVACDEDEGKAERAKPKGSLALSHHGVESEPGTTLQVATGHPEKRNDKPRKSAETTVEDDLDPAAKRIVAGIADSSPNRSKLECADGKRETYEAYKRLIKTGIAAADVWHDWWKTMRLMMASHARKEEYPILADWFNLKTDEVIARQQKRESFKVMVNQA